jgi:hypothetical protein
LAKLGIKVLPNDKAIKLYSIFHLEFPLRFLAEEHLFISYKVNSQGLYEMLFNDRIEYEAIHAAYYIDQLLSRVLPNDLMEHPMYKYIHAWILAISKVVIKRYFYLKYPNALRDSFNVTIYLNKIAKENKKEAILELLRLLKYCIELVREQLTFERASDEPNWITKDLTYLRFQEYVNTIPFDMGAIQAINVEI